MERVTCRHCRGTGQREQSDGFYVRESTLPYEGQWEVVGPDGAVWSRATMERGSMQAIANRYQRAFDLGIAAREQAGKEVGGGD